MLAHSEVVSVAYMREVMRTFRVGKVTVKQLVFLSKPLLLLLLIMWTM